MLRWLLVLRPDAEQSLMADVGNWQYPNNT